MRRISTLTLLLLCFRGVPALAQPAEVSRILRTFDFEERRLGNAEDLPMNWTKIEGPGLPHYVNGRLSTDVARSGQYSFRFDLNGGSLVYRYDPTGLKVSPGSHYRVEGHVRTTPLPNARARLTAYFADVDRRPIADTVRHSATYAAKSADDDWKKLSIELTADAPGAAYLVVELELLQPALFAPDTLGRRTLHTQDIHGTAWWDDVTVSQVPQVLMGTDRPGNIFRRSDPLRLRVTVNDRFTEDLLAQVVVRDAEGAVAFQRTGSADMAGAEILGPGRKRISLPLPELPAGWYSASLVMTSRGKFVGEHSLDFIRLADDGRTVPDERFGVIATDLPFAGWTELPDVLPFLSAGRVKLALWSKAGDVQEVEPAAFDRLLQKFSDLAIVPTACLIDLPPAVTRKLESKAPPKERPATAEKTEPPSWLKLLTASREDWQPQLAYLISRHATHIDRWQLGADGADSFVTRKEMRDVYRTVYHEFSALMENPDLAMPWPAWYELDGELPATVALSVPPSVLPHQLPLYMQDLRGPRSKGHNLSLSLQILNPKQYGRDAQIQDFSRRFIYALASGADRIDVPLPFSVRPDGSDLVKQPQELLLILRTLTGLLSGAKFQGKVPIAENVEAFLFDRNGQGIMVLWSRGNDSGIKVLPLNLGQRPVRVDLWGNASPLFQTTTTGRTDSASGAVALQIGPTPLFLLDVDGQLAQLRASVALDRPLLESSFQAHPRKIHFTNHYRTSISGTLKLHAPDGWTLTPPTFQFSLNPGETFDRDLTIEFPYNSFAGPKTLTAEFLTQGDRTTSFTVPLTLHLGLSDVGMQSLALRDGADVVVQQIVTNYGEKPIDYTAFAIVPGQARQERLITNLGPGNTTIKRYRFPNAHPTEGARIRLGIKELVGSRILNDEIAIQ